jgi:YNFM family putative membrane transporter
MKRNTAPGLQPVVFVLVSAAFTAIYLNQPVLPVIREEFGVDARQASFTVSAVILGIAVANLPFGRLSDRYPIQPTFHWRMAFVSVSAMIVAATLSSI